MIATVWLVGGNLIIIQSRIAKPCLSSEFFMCTFDDPPLGDFQVDLHTPPAHGRAPTSRGAQNPKHKFNQSFQWSRH